MLKEKWEIGRWIRVSVGVKNGDVQMNIRHRRSVDDQQTRGGEGGSEEGSGTRSSTSSGMLLRTASSLATRSENMSSVLKMESQCLPLRSLAR